MINQVVNNEQRRIFLLYGYKGTRKTFMWKTFFLAIQSQGKILFTLHQVGKHLSCNSGVE